MIKPEKNSAKKTCIAKCNIFFSLSNKDNYNSVIKYIFVNSMAIQPLSLLNVENRIVQRGEITENDFSERAYIFNLKNNLLSYGGY